MGCFYISMFFNVNHGRFWWFCMCGPGILLDMRQTEDFRGLWTRSLIAWPDGERDVSTRVNWLQGLSLFADLRQPAQLLSKLSTASCRDDLTAEDCLALSLQQGFSGRFETRDGAYEWVRHIDIQPPRPKRDIGRLFWRDEVLVEEGVETDYTEHWLRDEEVPEPDVAGLWLHNPADDVSGCLLRVGGWFAYARGRIGEIASESLGSLVAGAGSLQRMRSLVDCEISFGQVAPDCRIGRSSLPYKAGTTFGMRRQGDYLVLPDQKGSGQRIERVWQIVELEGDSSMIFDIIPQNF
jgi:hypothetical protein